jgi:uncharacterized membrane protein YhaH (DUF805 family)
MDRSMVPGAGFLATFLLFETIFLCAVVVFTIWVYWRIFVKAGYSGAISLLNLIPGVGSLICMIILAFGRWPIEDELAALRGGTVSPTMRPPVPPGTSVMPT